MAGSTTQTLTLLGTGFFAGATVAISGPTLAENWLVINSVTVVSESRSGSR